LHSAQHTTLRLSKDFSERLRKKNLRGKNGASPLKLVLKVENTVENTLLTKEKRLRKIS
jgi:hypothetical protein